MGYRDLDWQDEVISIGYKEEQLESKVAILKYKLTNLRHKLKEAGMTEDCIETVYGMGYRSRSNLIKDN